MSLPAYWEEFVEEYAADGIYWFFPKGATADTDDLRRKFAVFAQFQGKLWGGDLQRDYLAALRAAHLTEGETSALSRMLKRVFENLGLCYVMTGEPIRITEAGVAYLQESGASEVLDSHVWRYQYPNKLNNPPTTTGLSLSPHVVVVDMILACDNYITDQEFVLFVARMKQSSQTTKSIDRVKAWRSATTSLRQEVMNRLQGTRYQTIDGNSGYAMAFHRCDLLLDRRTDRLSVSGKNVEDLKAALEIYGTELVHVEFKDAPDTVAFYSDPERVPTKLEALDYYMDVSDVDRAVEVYKTLPQDLRTQGTVEEFKQSQFLEKHLEDFLETRLHLIESGLKKIGRQYKTAVGPIDLYARAANGDLVVIELKKDRAADKVFGQICRYIGCIKEDHAGDDENVRGFIIGRSIDEKLRYATRAVPTDLVTLQAFELRGNKGNEDWVQIQSF